MLEKRKINSMLMRMGGSSCAVSFLVRKGFTMEEIEEAVKEEYLLYYDDNTKIMKTEKGKLLF